MCYSEWCCAAVGGCRGAAQQLIHSTLRPLPVSHETRRRRESGRSRRQQRRGKHALDTKKLVLHRFPPRRSSPGHRPDSAISSPEWQDSHARGALSAARSITSPSSVRLQPSSSSSCARAEPRTAQARRRPGCVSTARWVLTGPRKPISGSAEADKRKHRRRATSRTPARRNVTRRARTALRVEDVATSRLNARLSGSGTSHEAALGR